MEIQVDGRTYPLLALSGDEFTWDEWREVKRLSGGILPPDFTAALAGMDPDAWRALVLLSVRRHNPAIPDDVLANTNFAETLQGWMEAMERESEEEAKRLAEEAARPPADVDEEPAAPTKSGDEQTSSSETGTESENGSGSPVATPILARTPGDIGR
jgi:hypothetical protein